MTSMLVLSVPSFAVYFCDLSLPATYTGNPLQMMSSDGIPLLPSQAGHIVPGGLYDRFAVPALVGEVCRNGEVRYPRVSDPENVDVADIPPDFKSVQLFHDSSSFEILSAAKLSRVSGAVSG